MLETYSGATNKNSEVHARNDLMFDLFLFMKPSHHPEAISRGAGLIGSGFGIQCPPLMNYN